MTHEPMKTEDIIIIKTFAKALDAAEAEKCKLNDQITTLKTMLANVNLHLREEIVSRDKTIAELLGAIRPAPGLHDPQPRQPEPRPDR